MKYLFLLTFLFGCQEYPEYLDPPGRFKAGDEVVIITTGNFYQGCTGVISSQSGYYKKRSECQTTKCDAQYKVSDVRCKDLLLKETLMVQDHTIELIKDNKFVDCLDIYLNWQMPLMSDPYKEVGWVITNASDGNGENPDPGLLFFTWIRANNIENVIKIGTYDYKPNSKHLSEKFGKCLNSGNIYNYFIYTLKE